MENFNEYWELFVDKKDSIAKEIIAYYKTLDDREDGTELSEQCCAFFAKNILLNPYPTCQLLNILAISKIPVRNNAIYELATSAALKAFNDEQYAEEAIKCYSILANSLISVKSICSLKEKLVHALDRKKIDLERLMLAIFSRKNIKLLVNLLPELTGPLKQQYTWDVLNKKQHFLNALLDSEQFTYVHHTNFIRFIHDVILANTHGKYCLPAGANERPLLDKSIDRPHLTAYLLELQRCCMLHSDLRVDEALIPARDFSQHSTVIGILARARIQMMDYDFATLFGVVKKNQSLIGQIAALQCKSKETSLECSETMALIQMQALIVLFKAMNANFRPDENNTNSSNNLDAQFKCLLKETDIQTFVQVTETLFMMLFARGELIPDGSSTTTERKRFICSLPLLGVVATSIKTIMITKKHSTAYLETSEQLKRRFQNILDLVIDVCWRLSLFDDSPPLLEGTGPPLGSKSTHRAIQITDLLSVPMTTAPQATENYRDSVSSLSGDRRGICFRSVESIIRTDVRCIHQRKQFGGFNGTLPRPNTSRRYARNTPTATGSSNSGESNKDLKLQSFLSMLPVPASKSTSSNKKAFTKLFASPETLAIVCLTNDRIHFALQIIGSYNLHDLPVGCIVQRVEQMQALKSNLSSLVQKHERTAESHAYGGELTSDGNSDTLLHDIRIKTAVGFEAFKVLSTIETYLKSLPAVNELTKYNDDTVIQPMDRFVGRYPFLAQHTGKNLHLSQIVDTVFNLPFKYELNLAIYSFLLKNVKPSAAGEPPASVMSTSMTGAGAEMSPQVGNYVIFFGELINTLQIAFRTGKTGDGLGNSNLTLGHLLSREICPLDAVENGVVLKRRARFYSMFHEAVKQSRTDLLIGTQRSALLNGFPSLGGTKQFATHLTDLVVSLEDVNMVPGTLSEAKKADILIQTDVPSVLLEGLFEKKASFTTLIAFTAKLGINFVHTIGKRLLRSDAPNIEHNAEHVLWKLIASKSQLLLRLCQTQLLSSSSPSTEEHFPSLILQYKKTIRNEISAGSLPQRIECKRARSANVHGAVDFPVLFPLLSSQTCCLLGARENAASSICLEGDLISMEQKALSLLANVDQFERAEQWISISEHLLTTVRTMQKGSISPLTRQLMEQKSDQLRTYLQIGTILRQQLGEDDDWRNVRNFSASNRSLVLQHLIEQCEYLVCAEWIKLHPIEAERELEMFMCAVHRVTAASNASPGLMSLQKGSPTERLFAIIETMPIEAVVKLYETIMLNIRSVPVVSYMLGYLIHHGERKPLYQKYAISLQIFESLAREEYDGLWNLASRPLLIIEQCLMNSRLELLAGVIRSIRPLLLADHCRPCYEHREYIRDLHEAVASTHAGQLASSGSVRRNPVHEDLFIGHECLDCLLRVYAGKALEYKVFPKSALDGVGVDGVPIRTPVPGSRVSSYDSLSETACPFVMPKEIPPRERWIKDEDALHCMCCRRTFSMLNRRHHCRRCGRVVCNSCSKRKKRLRYFYEDAAVRVCNDCWLLLKVVQGKEGASLATSTASRPAVNHSPDSARVESQFEWQLTGNERYDNVIRDEYSYEYAPSTGQCLAICNLHTVNDEIGVFLLYHCAKLEALLRPIHPGFPNPEIDYELVARMLLNLTLGVKVRGGGAEVEKMKEHAEIILSIVHDNCESLLLHTASMSSHGSLRKLRDALVKAEKWTLALELSLKCGFSLNGVMAAWGMTCLRAGCYETAREKFSHCLPRVADEMECAAVLRMIEGAPTASGERHETEETVLVVKRPGRCPPLLNEVLHALTLTARTGAPSQRVMERVRAARRQDSQTGAGATALTVCGHAPEPAMNILSTLANLRHISQGEFEDDDTGMPPIGERLVRAEQTSLLNSRFFEESMHYLLAYGSHQSVVAFLMRYRPTELAALRYILGQRVDPDVFLQGVLLPYLQRGALETVVQRLTDLDGTLYEWRDYIRYACRYLETNDMLNSLYHLQLLLKDPIRASMTCVRFYSAGCRTFTDLHASEHHLKTSINHLQNELELCNWEEVRLNSTGSAVETHRLLLMKLEPKELNNHINTSLLQLEVTKFLANCEAKGRQTVTVIPKICREMCASQLPTLFGGSQEKLQLSILTLVCGQNVEEAFGLSYRIIQDYNLDMQRVYALTAKYCINQGKIEDVGKLLDAIVGNGVGPSTEPVVSSVCDEIVRVSVDAAVARQCATKVALEALINRASSVAVRVHCYVVTGQLKTAYLLANRHHRIGDVRKILRQAELLGQAHVKRLCEARLNHHEEEGGGRAGGAVGTHG